MLSLVDTVLDVSCTAALPGIGQERPECSQLPGLLVTSVRVTGYIPQFLSPSVLRYAVVFIFVFTLTNMVKTYILAPNWTTAPPTDGNGPIKLGHLLDELTEFVPVNRRGIVDIPTELLNKVDIKDGFQSSRNRLVSGELGFFAKVVGLFGIGAGAGIYYKKDKNDILSCKTLETMTFDPTAEYIAQSMAQPEVTKYMDGCQFKEPLYMVTGFKIGRGGSLQSTSSRNRSLKLEGGLNPPGSPINFEGNVGFSMEETQSEIWEGSTDFIVAFRVRKIWYQRGDIKNKAFNKNVVMHDGGQADDVPDKSLQANDNVQEGDVSREIELKTDRHDEEEGESWILPTCA